MRCIVTAGPTYEELDDVRRLTNMSTGRLGLELATFLHEQGHEVVLLIGEQSTWQGERVATDIQEFSTTVDLQEKLRAFGGDSVGAVFHAAAVSDFAFGKIYERDTHGELAEVSAGKVSTRSGTLLAELIPTSKIISELRDLFPMALIVGWKFEVDGTRSSVVSKAVHQIRENTTNVCIANGPAYGNGFGIIDSCGKCDHSDDRETLFKKLDHLISD